MRKRRKRPTYDDQFRASAVVMLKAQGYPDVEGALTAVAKHLKVPAMTLSRWFKGTQNPPPNQIVTEKTIDLQAAIEAELQAIIGEFQNAREFASFGQLGTVFGILFDKKRLLENLPTEIVGTLPELIAALQAIGLKPSDVFGELLTKAKAEAEARRADGQ